MKIDEYWLECISLAIDECGLSATKEQIEYIAGIVQGSHENYGMAHGYDCIPNPLVTENKKLKSELERERDKVICPSCKGAGGATEYYGTRSSWIECFKCNGNKRIDRRML